MSVAYSGYWTPTRINAPMKPTKEYFLVSLCTFCQSATISAGTTRSMVSFDSTATAAQSPAATWCHRCLRGE